MNAAAAELAGTRLSKILNMVNTSMFVFKHPKYYKELRERNKSDQVISKEPATAGNQRAPGPGHKLDVPAPAGPSVKPQATSSKPQAPSIKLSNQPEQATSHKLQAPSYKRQA